MKNHMSCSSSKIPGQGSTNHHAQHRRWLVHSHRILGAKSPHFFLRILQTRGLRLPVAFKPGRASHTAGTGRPTESLHSLVALLTQTAVLPASFPWHVWSVLVTSEYSVQPAATAQSVKTEAQHILYCDRTGPANTSYWEAGHLLSFSVLICVVKLLWPFKSETVHSDPGPSTVSLHPPFLVSDNEQHVPLHRF